MQPESEPSDAPSPPASPTRRTVSHSGNADRAERRSNDEHLRATAKPAQLSASADSLLMMVSIDEPKAAYATLSNMLFKSVDVRPFVVVVDYRPVKVRATLVRSQGAALTWHQHWYRVRSKLVVCRQTMQR